MAPVSIDLFTVPRPDAIQGRPGELTPAQLKQFYDEGYVVVEDYFDKTELEPVLEDLAHIVDELAEKLYAAGKITDRVQDADVYHRLTQLEKQFRGVGILMHKRHHPPESLRNIWTSEKLLNAAEQLVGPDISGHPVWNIRCKTPVTEEATVPWHQDTSYLTPAADDVMMPTAWIPLLDTNKTNGCMEVLPGGHRRGITATHVCCAGGTWYTELPAEEMKNTLGVDPVKDSIICEVPFGGVLFINNLIPHRSLENYSDVIRWSLDLRWHATDTDNCFHGLKPSVEMRSSSKPDLEIDWSAYLKGEPQHVVEARAARDGCHGSQVPDDVEKEFATDLPGPWMSRWELVHHNKHTASWVDPHRGGKLMWHS